MINMQTAMANDLSELFNRDMPAECKIGAAEYTVLVNDMMSEETEAYGGPEAMELQMVHFLTTEKSSIEPGSKLALRQKAKAGEKPQPWKSKIVISSIASADGNELIVTVRGD